MDTDVIQVGQSGTALIDEIRLMPGNNGFTSIYNDTTEVVRVTNDGKIGVGTSTPTEKLQVAGNISASGDLTINGSHLKVLNHSGAYEG